MNEEKEKLERAFKESLKQSEDASASSSLRYQNVFGALHTLLTKWDALEEGDANIELGGDGREIDESLDLPRDLINAVISRTLSNLDPVKNVDLVRDQLLSTLRSLETASCRQVVLDLLPTVTQVFVGTNSTSSTWIEGKSKRAKKQILSCLREVFESDPNSLSQILEFFSSILGDILSRKHVIVSSDVFHFVVESLPKVPETNLHIALQALIQFVNSSDDARLAVDSVRTELALLEKTEISDMTPMAHVFGEVAQGRKKNEELFVEEYFVSVEELVNEEKKMSASRQDKDRQVDDVEIELLTFDLVMVLALKDSDVYRDRILRIVADGSLIESGILSAERITRLVELANGDRACTSETTIIFGFKSDPHVHLLQSLVEFSMSLLVTPLHCPAEFDAKTLFSKIQVLLIDVIMKLPEEYQKRAISVALNNIDELLKTTETENTDGLRRKGKTSSKVCQNVFLLLLSLVSRRRKIFLPFKERLVNYIMSESFDEFGNIDVLKTLCSLAAQVYCNSDSAGSLHGMTLCRNLLFSPPPSFGTATRTAQMQAKLACRQIRGMLFANAIISICDLDSKLLSAIQKMVSKVLLPAHSTMVLLDPRVGLHGMKILRCIREQPKCEQSLRKASFRVMSLILSHSRIVSYPESAPEKATTKPNRIFVYSDMPAIFPFANISGKQLRFRKMVFRFDSFLANEALLNEPSSWEKSSVWIFELIDTYLALGRTAKWNPRAWVFAGFEFPSVISSSPITAKRKEKLSNWFKSLFADFENSHHNRMPISKMDKHISELIKGTKAISEKDAIIASISRFGLTLLFALSTSMAVLRNTYLHFQSLLEDKCSEIEDKDKNEALQMIHFQFAKIYDLQHACQSIERLFRNLASRGHARTQNRSKKTKRRRLNRPSVATGKTNFQIQAELVALSMRESLTKLLSSAEYVPKKLFWICLTDPSHDSFVISAVKHLQQKKTFEPILEVIKLRLNWIKHLAVIRSYSTKTEEWTERFRENLFRCLRLTSFLLLNFQSLKEDTEHSEAVDGLVELTSENIRLTCSILVSTRGDDIISGTRNHHFSEMLGLYLSTFGPQKRVDSAVEGRATSELLNLEDFEVLVTSFQDHIFDDHTSVTSQLLETLSVFAARPGSELLDRMIDIHWDATFLSEYANGEKQINCTSSPFSLTELLKSMSRYKPQGFVNADIEEHCSHRIMTKLMKHSYSKSLQRHQYLVHSMRRHWGLLALSPERFKFIARFLNTLLGELTKYLRDIDDYLVGQEVDSNDNEALAEDEDDDDDEYLPPSTTTPVIRKPSIPSSSDFACLTSRSYPIYLDMLMRMTVSSVALFSISEEMANFKQPLTTSYTHHPVYQLERMVITFGALLELYKGKFHIFPKFLDSSITNVSKCMLDVSVMKIQEYVEWRNCQPVLRLEEGEFKGFDVASTSYLKKLLDTFGQHVVGPLREFCSAYSGSKSLARKNERTFEFLSQTSNRYSTGEIKTENTVRRTTLFESEALTKVSEDYSKTEQSSNMAESSHIGSGHEELRGEIINEIDSSLLKRRGPRRFAQSRPDENIDPSYSDDANSFLEDNEDTSSSASEAFGVSGDWGQDSEDSDKEYGSEFFIDRFHKSS